MGIIGSLVEGIAEIGRIERTSLRETKNLTDVQKESLDALINRAESGDIQAMEVLADAYLEGIVLRYDPDEVCRWWTKAAEAGSVNSMYNLGLLYRGDISKQFYNDELSAYWLKAAGERGDLEAQRIFNETFKYSMIFKKWVRR